MIRIYDSLSREVVPLEPLEPGQVRMYVCGPTVYDDCHIGHLMGPVLFDCVARWLLARGLRVRFVNNITDIDDKIINRSRQTGEDWSVIAERYTAQYLGFLEELGVATITDHPRCTDYVPQMIDFIQQLVDEDKAYPTSDGVYFDVERQKDYGKLSGRKLEDMLSGARVEAGDELRHSADFALWKLAKPGEPSWESPWGAGRPGWHIECSVMAGCLLGDRFDVHGGGDDLKFPHHENEIAQSEAHGESFAHRWMHNGLVQYGGRKVAKSDPRMQDPEFSRQFQARWLLDEYSAPAIRFFLLRGHYRRPIDFEPHNLESARTGLVRLLRLLGELVDEPEEVPLATILERPASEEMGEHRRRFCAAMDQDFGTGEAIAELFSIAQMARGREGDARVRALRMLCDLGRLLGLFRVGDLQRVESGGPQADAKVGAVLDAALRIRASRRAAKDFASADAVRDALQAAGVAIHDSPEGSSWELQSEPGEALAKVMQILLGLRESARGAKDFATADSIRDELLAAGIQIHDDPGGARWEL